MHYFLQGLTLGLTYVAPIGVQNLFVIDSALTQRRKRAILSALIVIFFDITLALGCFFGIGTVMEHYPWVQSVILGIGSLIVIYIGISLIRDKGDVDKKSYGNMPVVKVITTACVVTWFNPQAILDGTMMLGAFRATLPPAESTHYILGVTSASCIWFIGLTILVSLIHNFFTKKVLRILNLICGSVITLYGIRLLIQFFTKG